MERAANLLDSLITHVEAVFFDTQTLKEEQRGRNGERNHCALNFSSHDLKAVSERRVGFCEACNELEAVELGGRTFLKESFGNSAELRDVLVTIPSHVSH